MSALPALAQDGPGANGRWWPATRDGFAWNNPASAIYFRGGLGIDITAFGTPANASCDGFFGCPPFSTGLGEPGSRVGFAALAALGTRLTPALRVELATSIGPMTGSRANGINAGQPSHVDANVRSLQFMGNVFLDVAPLLRPGALGAFNPYVMGGIGLAVHTLHASETLFPPQPVTLYYPAGQNAAFAWQLGAGVQWQAGNSLIFDLGYNYLDAGSARSGGGNTNCTVAPGPFIILCIPPGDGARLRVPVRTHRVMLSVIIPLDGLVGR